MSLMSRIAKKIRRRFRKKGTHAENPSATMTTAEKLIMNNWGITFSNKEPERAGLYRAIDRQTAKRKANAKIPEIEREPSRQVFRAYHRRMLKEHHQRKTVKHTQKRTGAAVAG